MSQIFYPKEVKKVKYDKEDYPMNEELKDNLIPFEPPLFATTNKKPRIPLEDMVQPKLKENGGPYKSKVLDKFMDSVHQTYHAFPEFCKELIDYYEDAANKGSARHGLTHAGLDNDLKNNSEINLLDFDDTEKYVESSKKSF